ncbi:hypothetical protein POM88_050698 [Heracleum sosnowskyi]|uniref:TIR domain-containing protein n=1 Tax=Heracleum sosnowskyi TaxID=360622 RepID=A0AAD8GY54_9APIA|nr:hypothetical protein POM88_050698 [Heracleum sosnowskyi]
MSKEDTFYHVFLSFKGETREKITCFLYEALKDEGFVAFMDKTDIKIGDDLGNYGSALEKHRLRHGDKVDKWRQTLEEVGNVLGEPVAGLNNTFIRRVVKLFREKMAAKFPECHLLMPKSSFMTGSSPSPSTRHELVKDKVILYTTNIDNGLVGLGAENGLVKMFLATGKIVHEEKNCSKEPKYLTELEELVGNNKVRFPMVIVNGKDLCGEEVEGLDNYEIYRARSMKDIIRIIKRFDGSFQETRQILSTTLKPG